MTEPYFPPKPGWTQLRDVPGWGPLYEQLQADIASLDPDAQVIVVQRPHCLHLHVVHAKPEVLQAVRDLCFDAEGASVRTCQVCGERGEVRLAAEQSRWRVRCGEHAAEPIRYSTWQETKAKRAAMEAEEEDRP